MLMVAARDRMSEADPVDRGEKGGYFPAEHLNPLLRQKGKMGALA